ncbi:hypothetical protein LGN12_18990 [Burkholderia multivorans]|uniref:hypothetical protein n=1 Tax=Burkholderia multivorans TaxID=87883 RepID=UPI0021C1E598|nr:hypothetical protein [Burkholderia multivorans]MCA8249251.1 hypothetical protein [Burkholderia multivorans]MCA8480227.1 hypothetical protein [Burkholderia multivorans]
MERIETSRAELAEVFADWKREYRESPELFFTPAESAVMDPDAYGSALAEFVVEKITERRKTSA